MNKDSSTENEDEDENTKDWSIFFQQLQSLKIRTLGEISKKLKKIIT